MCTRKSLATFSDSRETQRLQRGNSWCASDLCTAKLTAHSSQKTLLDPGHRPPRVRLYSDQDAPDQLLADPGAVGPHPRLWGWLSTPPGVQRYLGMVWLTALLYPESADYDLQELVTEYYQVFYGYELSDAYYKEMTAEAMK